MADMSGNIVCRAAREEDYEAVIEIDKDSLERLDYVRSQFHYYLTSPDHYPFVVEVDGEIVGFAYKFIVDDETAAVRGGGRVKADLRGRGLSRIIVQYTHNEIARLRPTAAQRSLYTSLETPLQLDLIKRGKAKLLLQRALRHYVTNMESIRRHIQSFRYNMLSRKYGVDHVITPGKEQLIKLLMASPELFPGGCFVAFKDPYMPLVSNFNYVADTCICQITPSDDSMKAKAASFGFHFPCQAGLRFDLEYYGTDTSLLLQHMLKALLCLSKLDYEGDIHYILYFPLHLNTREIENMVAANFNWKLGEWSKYPGCLVLEEIPKINPKL